MDENGPYLCVCNREYKTIRGLLRHLEQDDVTPRNPILVRLKGMRKAAEKFDHDTCGYLCMTCHSYLTGNCQGCTYYKLTELCDQCWA